MYRGEGDGSCKGMFGWSVQATVCCSLDRGDAASKDAPDQFAAVGDVARTSTNTLI